VLAAGAHNTIVTSRAGKDLVSCLVSGLLTIGPRFGGAIDDAARNFKAACDQVGGLQQLLRGEENYCMGNPPCTVRFCYSAHGE
jgi:citrate synthase